MRAKSKTTAEKCEIESPKVHLELLARSSKEMIIADLATGKDEVRTLLTRALY